MSCLRTINLDVSKFNFESFIVLFTCIFNNLKIETLNVNKRICFSFQICIQKIEGWFFFPLTTIHLVYMKGCKTSLEYKFSSLVPSFQHQTPQKFPADLSYEILRTEINSFLFSVLDILFRGTAHTFLALGFKVYISWKALWHIHPL